MNAWTFKVLTEVSPVLAGKVAGELLHHNAKIYSAAPSVSNMINLNKKATQADRIKDVFSKRTMKGRDLGSAFDEHKKLALDRLKFINYKEPKRPKPSLGTRMKNSWNSLSRSEKMIAGFLGVSVGVSSAAAAAEVRAENKLHKQGRKST